MSALDDLFLEMEKHAVMRAHGNLCLDARNELINLRIKLETAEGELIHIKKWVGQDQSVLSKEQICWTVASMCDDALILNYNQDK